MGKGYKLKKFNLKDIHEVISNTLESSQNKQTMKYYEPFVQVIGITIIKLDDAPLYETT